MMDTRAVSPVFGYTLTLGVITLLTAGLVVSAGGYVEGQREATIQSDLQVIGQQVSADVAAVDRMAKTQGADVATVERTIPRTTVGAGYSITAKNDGNGPTEYYLELKSTEPDVTVKVGLSTQLPVEGRVDGGTIVVEYNRSEQRLEVRNA